MTDYDSIWRTQDEIRTVVNAVLGECIWNLSYSERSMAIELELTVTLDDDVIGNLCCQFPITADYDGVGKKGRFLSLILFFLRKDDTHLPQRRFLRILAFLIIRYACVIAKKV